MTIVEILYIVFWVFGLLLYPWPNTRMASYPFISWSPHIFYMLMFALAGIALFERGGMALLH